MRRKYFDFVGHRRRPTRLNFFLIPIVAAWIVDAIALVAPTLATTAGTLGVATIAANVVVYGAVMAASYAASALLTTGNKQNTTSLGGLALYRKEKTV